MSDIQNTYICWSNWGRHQQRSFKTPSIPDISLPDILGRICIGHNTVTFLRRESCLHADLVHDRFAFFPRLTLHPLPLSDLSRETRLDSLYRSPRTTRIACNKVQSVLTLAQFSIGRPASLASNIFHDISSQDILDLLLLESTLDDQSLASVD